MGVNDQNPQDMAENKQVAHEDGKRVNEEKRRQKKNKNSQKRNKAKNRKTETDSKKETHKNKVAKKTEQLRAKIQDKKVVENFVFPFEENDIMTCYEGRWVMRAAVPTFQEMKLQVDAIEDPKAKAVYAKKYKNAMQKSSRKLKISLMKQDKPSRKPAKKVFDPALYVEDGKMTQYYGVWVQKSALPWLNSKANRLIAQSHGKSAVEQMTREDFVKEVLPRMKKILRQENRKLKQHLLSEMESRENEDSD